MTKLCNSYPEDIACMLCFPCVFQTTEESILGWSEDCWCFQVFEWKLEIDRTVNLFQLLSGAVGQLEEFIVETFGVKHSEWFRSVLFIGGFLPTKTNSTNVESETYSDYFNPMSDISNDTFPKKLKPNNMIGTLSWSEFLNVFLGNLQFCFVLYFELVRSQV